MKILSNLVNNDIKDDESSKKKKLSMIMNKINSQKY